MSTVVSPNAEASKHELARLATLAAAARAKLGRIETGVSALKQCIDDINKRRQERVDRSGGEGTSEADGAQVKEVDPK